ncbi:erythroid membrane-associated protein isoform X1 [Esox lucius]|uniref:erythroid membrane-associated protein isoform X1 n=1 Tax=Esox lucius TaxID=8010 RepID=UPI001476F3AF|nr:erythroid membrane-associated protein isoform X1 [Esox lucius]
MIKECLQFLIEPAKKIKIRLKESRKKVKNEKKEPLVESQLFIMELARELNRLCQRSSVLAHIWTCEDTWPPSVCREFIVEWAAVLENRVQTRSIQRELHVEWSEKRDWKDHLLCMLETGGEHDIGGHKRVILDWTYQLKNRLEPNIWPGETVLMMLDDLEFQWRRGRLPTLLPAMELIMEVVLSSESPENEDVTKQWLIRKQRSQRIDAARYIPHNVWTWICDAAEEVTLDPKTANPYLILSNDNKRMRCGLEPRDSPNCTPCFNGWWCAMGNQGYTSGRHYWEVEVGDRDWRLGVATASAQRKGYGSLNTQTGYLTLRLERGTDLKALTLPVTPLTQAPVPKKVGVYLDYEQGQLSFYDVEKRSHIYTYNETFTERLFPLFGTVEVVKDMVIRSAQTREPCLCPGPCLWC